MAEGQLLFTLEYKQFSEILNRQNWFNLQHEFGTAGVPLSHSFLIWEEEPENAWLLADFETKKTYDIEKKRVKGVEESETVDISGPSDQEEQLIGLRDPEAIFSLLQQSPQGTHEGSIDFVVTKFDLGTIDLEKLKRSDLLGAGFSFEFVHHDLSTAHKMLHEILTSPRESLLDLSRSDFQQFTNYLTEFYKNIEQIGNFETRGERPGEIHSSLLREISSFCENVKNTLSKTITYLMSKKVEQLEDQVKTTVTDAEEKLNTETEKFQRLSEEAQQQTAEIVQKLEQTHLKYQNQLTEKPISQYKTIFNDQAKKHGKTAWVWLWTTVGLTLVSAGIFWWVLKDLVPAANDLPAVLPNLLAKGFFLSLIYLILNRSIKNYTAEKHLEVINVHRQNALETVDPFLDATKENRETRDQILLAATKAIYDANQSGYLSTKISGSDGASPVQQIIKEVIPSKSSDKSD